MLNNVNNGSIIIVPEMPNKPPKIPAKMPSNEVYKSRSGGCIYYGALWLGALLLGALFLGALLLGALLLGNFV